MRMHAHAFDPSFTGVMSQRHYHKPQVIASSLILSTNIVTCITSEAFIIGAQIQGALWGGRRTIWFLHIRFDRLQVHRSGLSWPNRDISPKWWWSCKRTIGSDRACATTRVLFVYSPLPEQYMCRLCCRAQVTAQWQDRNQPAALFLIHASLIFTRTCTAIAHHHHHRCHLLPRSTTPPIPINLLLTWFLMWLHCAVKSELVCGCEDRSINRRDTSETSIKKSVR